MYQNNIVVDLNKSRFYNLHQLLERQSHHQSSKRVHVHQDIRPGVDHRVRQRLHVLKSVYNN